jgi:hypothetical protein
MRLPFIRSDQMRAIAMQGVAATGISPTMQPSTWPAGSNGRNSWSMKVQPSSAMEKRFTSQFIPTVAAMPRQCAETRRSAPKSIYSSIGTIISQTSSATGR